MSCDWLKARLCLDPTSLLILSVKMLWLLRRTSGCMSSLHLHSLGQQWFFGLFGGDARCIDQCRTILRLPEVAGWSISPGVESVNTLLTSRGLVIHSRFCKIIADISSFHGRYSLWSLLTTDIDHTRSSATWLPNGIYLNSTLEYYDNVFNLMYAVSASSKSWKRVRPERWRIWKSPLGVIIASCRGHIASRYHADVY